ncbi:hypothetical protein Ndes2437B_g02221 [Nannochloris sp. 'desiccata']
MLGFQRLAGLIVWCVLVVLQWFHVCFVAIPAQWWLDNVVITAEESTKATVREYFSLFGRVINGVASWLVALFVDRSLFYRGKRHQAHKRSSAWKEFLEHSKKRGTFNAVIEQEGLIPPRSRSLSPPPRGNRAPRGSFRSKQQQQSSNSSSWWPSSDWFYSNDSNTNGSTSRIASTFQQRRHQHHSEATNKDSGRSNMKRSGSDLFNRPSGFAVSERMDRRGLGESLWLSVELAIESVFAAFRSMVIAVLFLRATPGGATTPQSETTAAVAEFFSPEFSFHPNGDATDINGSENDRFSNRRKQRRSATAPAAPARADADHRRTHSFGSWEDMGVWTASDVILQAGYPLEEHVVTTSDGYILTMQRIPRKDSKEVVFFMHGILDTSLGWVSNGTQGSQAFAAYDRGADVFLGNCRANPPRAHVDASRSGAAYWCYSINELGMEDVAAQMYRIHAVKTAELGSSGDGAAQSGFNMSSVVGGEKSRTSSMAGVGVVDASRSEKSREKTPGMETSSNYPSPSPSPRSGMHKRSGSDSALAAVHNMNRATERLASEEGVAASAPPNEQHIKAHNLAKAEAEEAAKVAAKTKKTSSGASASGTKAKQGGRTNPSKSSKFVSSFLGNSKLGRTRSGPVDASTFASLSLSPSSSSIDTDSNSGSGFGRGAAALSPTTSVLDPLEKKERVRNYRGNFFSKLMFLGRDEKMDDSGRTHAAQKLKSFRLPHPVHEDNIEEEVDAGESPTALVLNSSPFEQGKQENLSSGSTSLRPPPPLSLPSSSPNPPKQQQQQEQQPAHKISSSSLRAPSLHLPTTPADSTECTPRCAAAALVPPQEDPLMTPDRVSVGGREQAPLQWAVYTRSTGSYGPRRSMSSSSTSISPLTTVSPTVEPYHLQAVGHSLGGAALIIYAVMCKVLGRQHHLSRLVLLTPGGFHKRYPKVALPFMYIIPVLMKLLNFWRPGVGCPAYIPSSLLRYITFKLTVDLQHVPALNELTRAGLRLLLNGDASEWDQALQMPHYAVASMPAISLHTGSHLMQLMSAKKFLLYDYGSLAANRKHYGTDVPPDVAAHYHLLQGLPIDLVAGRSDGVIAREDVETHYEAMKAAGLEVTLKELDVGHLDVTFAVKDEVQHYVMSRLKLNNNSNGRGFFFR